MFLNKQLLTPLQHDCKIHSCFGFPFSAGNVSFKTCFLVFVFALSLDLFTGMSASLLISGRDHFSFGHKSQSKIASREHRVLKCDITKNKFVKL